MAGRAALLEPASSNRRAGSGSSLSSSSGLGTSATLFTDLSLVGVETGVGSQSAISRIKTRCLIWGGGWDGSDPLNFKADVALDNH